MKVLLAILIGVTLGVGIILLTAPDYQTSDESNVRLFERVFAKLV